MHPWPSCNGRTRNAVSMSIWVCTRPHYFYCPSPDFTTSIVSQSVTSNHCAPSCEGNKRKVRGHIKKISAGDCPPLANCFRRHCLYLTDVSYHNCWQYNNEKVETHKHVIIITRFIRQTALLVTLVHFHPSHCSGRHIRAATWRVKNRKS